MGCTVKAYRWVEEMNQIGECFAQEGAWQEQAKVFREIAGVFQGLADVVEKEGTDGMGEVGGVVGTLEKNLKERKGGRAHFTVGLLRRSSAFASSNLRYALFLVFFFSFFVLVFVWFV